MNINTINDAFIRPKQKSNRDKNREYKALLEGTVFSSKSYGEFKIIEYLNQDNMIVEFLVTGTKTRISYIRAKAGMVYDWMCPSVYGVGYIGARSVGKKGSIEIQIYRRWVGMLQRCYSGDKEGYEDVEVNETWHNFQNFLAWFKSNNYTKDLSLDKDLLIRGSRVYGPDTCCLLPKEVNMFLVKPLKKVGAFMLGVNRTPYGRFTASACNGTGNGTRCIGVFDSEIEAFEAYKKFKGELAKTYAFKYKDVLSAAAFAALMDFNVLPYG